MNILEPNFKVSLIQEYLKKEYSFDFNVKPAISSGYATKKDLPMLLDTTNHPRITTDPKSIEMVSAVDYNVTFTINHQIPNATQIPLNAPVFIYNTDGSLFLETKLIGRPDYRHVFPIIQIQGNHTINLDFDLEILSDKIVIFEIANPYPVNMIEQDTKNKIIGRQNSLFYGELTLLSEQDISGIEVEILTDNGILFVPFNRAMIGSDMLLKSITVNSESPVFYQFVGVEFYNYN